MEHLDEARAIVFKSLQRINATIARKSPVPLAIESPLFGRRSTLSSLGLVHLVATIEQQLREQYSNEVSLVDERVVAGEIRPFRSVGTLVDYVATILGRSSA